MQAHKYLFLLAVSCFLLFISMTDGRSMRNYDGTMPIDTEQNRFTKTVLSEKLDEPLQMIIFKDNKVLFIERKGNVKLYDPKSNTTNIIATIPVSTKYKSKQGKISEAEDGLLGVTLDPGFDKNHWLYLYYSAAGDAPRNILARYEYINHELILPSRKIVLEVPTQREQCCHTGGKMAWDEDDNMYLTTGDNTSSKATAYSPSDEREGRSAWDAQGTSANTNDLRGKILRIHPENDGTYTVPDGNLFPKGTDKTKPEIYVMGIRNPYSVYYDKPTKTLFWGEVGPDAGKDSVGRGPRSYDEWNRTTKPGFFGWPYFVADNKAYNKYNFATGEKGELADPEHPVNNSPNNTGLKNLPPTNKALIWYSYNLSDEFPVLGTGGRSAMLGPVYRAENYPAAKRLPEYYNGKLFIFEWLRDWIITVSLDKDNNYKSMERFLPGLKFSHPMDLKFGPDGDMYVLEYGQGWFSQNNDSQLTRISYNAGNRKPNIVAKADKTTGAVPLKVAFSSEGTTDFDKDELTYKWTITSPLSKVPVQLKGENPSYTFLKRGVYKAKLTVTDTKGAASTQLITVKAGNSAPVIDIKVAGNQSYYLPGNTFAYSVVMRDKEDGVIPGGKIPASKLKVNIAVVPDEEQEAKPGHQAGPESFAAGKALMLRSDCKACHDDTRKIIGPAYKTIAAKYTYDDANVEKLATKVINGGSGVWGEMSMSAHPQLPKDDAKAIVSYILNIASIPSQPENLPAKGSFTPADASGPVVIKAAYTDKGVPGIPSASVQKTLTLNSPVIQAASGKLEGDFQVYGKRRGRSAVSVKKPGTILFENMDVTGVQGFDVNVSTPNNNNGGKIEIRLDKPDGELLATATVGQGLERRSISLGTKLLTGRHNVYFVFSGTDSQQDLFFIDTITLKGK